ncbi:MAG: GNAT family N-acetyltransferase [Microthrixaceae bacterium]
MVRLPERTDTERLMICRLTPDDEPSLAAAVTANLEHLRPWFPWIAFEPVSPEDRRELLATWEQEWRDGGDLVCGILIGDEYLGNIGLHRRGASDELMIGYWLHIDHTGRGYMTEAAAAMTSLAFDQAGIERVSIHHDRANVASGAVPRRLGYTLDEEVNEEIEAPGETGVQYRWRVARDAWATRRCA